MKSMKEKFPLILLIVFFLGLWLYAIKNRELHNEPEVHRVSAMMHNNSFNSLGENNSELTDEDYELIGDKWMEVIMGDEHEVMEEQMRETMGEDFLTQMHIAMGKRAQSSDSISMKGMEDGTGNMMGRYRWPLAASTKYGRLHSVIAVVTWLSLITFLLAGARWFWKKAGQ